MAVLLLVLAVIFLMGALVTTGKSIGASKVRKELESHTNYEPSETGDEPFACDALVTRVFEQRLVDAGIMKAHEMTVCEDTACRDCAPTRKMKCAVVDCDRPATMPERFGDSLCLTCYETRYPPKELRQVGKPKGLAGKSRYDKAARQGELKIKIEHHGVKAEFDWPAQIPTYAAPVVDVNNYERHTVRVKFLWTDSTNGKQMAQVVMFPMLEWGGGSPKGTTGDLVDVIDESSRPLRRESNVKLTLPTLGREEREERAARREAAINDLVGREVYPPRPPKGRGAGSPVYVKHTLNRKS